MNKQLSVEPIVNGELSPTQEIDFFKSVENTFLKIVCDDHDFKNVDHMKKGEVLRLTAHVENLQSKNYTELAGINSKLFIGTQITLVAKLNKVVREMTLPNHYFNLTSFCGTKTTSSN